MKLVSDTRTRYRILFGTGYTRDGVSLGPIADHEPGIHEAARILGAYSLQRRLGYWEGIEEPGFVLEHVGTNGALVEEVAMKIAVLLNQAEVWITSDPVAVTRVVR